MARIKYSGLVDSINGSINGTTFQRNRYGHTVKGKPVWTNPQSQFQNNRKTILAAMTREWRTMSGTEQQSWIDYADTFPFPTRLNPDSYLNGFNYFTKYNCIRYLANQNVVRTVSQTQYNNSVTNIFLEADGSDVNFSFSYSSFTFNHSVLIFLSPVIQPYSSPRSNKTRFIKAFVPDVVFSFTEVNAAYAQRFGTAMQAGDSVYIDVTFINNLSGQILEWPTSVIEVTV